MPFVNEIATEQDIVKYGLVEQFQEFFKGSSMGDVLLTIDREKNTYLRYMRSDEREDPVTHTFIFFWRGTRVDLVLATVYFSTIRREYLEQTVKIWNTCPPTNSFWLPDALEPRRQDIIADFKAAIIARRGIVASGEYEVCKFNFEF